MLKLFKTDTSKQKEFLCYKRLIHHYISKIDNAFYKDFSNKTALNFGDDDSAVAKALRIHFKKVINLNDNEAKIQSGSIDFLTCIDVLSSKNSENALSLMHSLMSENSYALFKISDIEGFAELLKKIGFEILLESSEHNYFMVRKGKI